MEKRGDSIPRPRNYCCHSMLDTGIIFYPRFFNETKLIVEQGLGILLRVNSKLVERRLRNCVLEIILRFVCVTHRYTSDNACLYFRI